jgi:CheY-like chemotaxis protein
MNAAKRIQILLVEDNPDDVLLTAEVLRETEIPSDLHLAMDGEEAMDFLHRRDPYADVPVPDLVLLDLNLPKKDGRQVLVELKADPKLRRIPVIVLTTSAADRDVLHAYDTHVNAYVRSRSATPHSSRSSVRSRPSGSVLRCCRRASSSPSATGP